MKPHECGLCCCETCCGGCVVVAEYPADEETINEPCAKMRDGETVQ